MGTQKSRVGILLAAIVISGITTFMFYPLIALELIARGQSPGSAGLILGFLSGTGLILSGVIGSLNARLGSKALAVAGLVVRTAGLLVFAFPVGTPVYIVGAIVASLGSSANGLAIKTELMRTSASRNTITLRSIAVNLGALVGPSVGGLLYLKISFTQIVYLATASYVLLAVVLAFVKFQPPEADAAEAHAAKADTAAAQATVAPHPAANSGRGSTGLDGPFVLLLVCTFCYWAIYSQWNLVVPIYATAGFGTHLGSSWIFTGNAVLILALQYLLIVKALKNIAAEIILGAGFVLFEVAFLILLTSPSIISAIAFATVFSLAELLISPTLDEVTAQLRQSGSGLTKAFGITATVSGVASLLCSFGGGRLIDTFDAAGGVGALTLPVGLVGIGCAVALSRRKTP
ncbi:MFS transporter [Corynebacterium lizhenjunii]|uniref:MFS transporter n=1 Tax=Corynebacterium lizhenjunii TaxID=2709394 RepID=A0A7T0KEE6_9CORY|nr:MFS transporter [Corynebacterium lizhenjunii]QPK79280.1 MFS transporter [Corynebacterium lizhenjunii]